MKRRLLICMLTAVLAAAASSWSAAAAEFEIRAAYVDCRAEVRTMPALKEFAENAAHDGMNAIVMEWEAAFPFEDNATICNSFAYTREEVVDFIGFCNGLGLDVIPLQNCFGHSEYILLHDRYSGIREDRKDPSQVCPRKIDEAVEVFRSIFSEVAGLHNSRYFHIGADETYLLGQCPRCREFAGKHGKSRLFVEYVNAMCGIVRELGKTPVIWADIILEHPEAVNDLPKDVIFVDWNYGWDIRHRDTIRELREKGVQFWGATALRSGPDNIYLTQWKKHFNNLVDFVAFSAENGYSSMIQTSWSTSGTYGYHYDSGNEITDMQPVRLVYPESGFRILNAATAEAYAAKGRFNPEEFVIRYASEELGLSMDGGKTLWEYFCMPQETVSAKTGKDASGTPVRALVEQAEDMLSRLGRLRPGKGKVEMEHFVLMLKLRINYLKFKEIESQFESSGFHSDGIPALKKSLENVCSEGRRIDREFTGLNRGYLKDGEIRYFCRARGEKMEALLKTLSR